MSSNYKVAIVGASGLVGRTVLKILEEKAFSSITYTLFSSAKSAGSKIRFLNQDYILCELNETSFDTHFDYAIFCAGGSVSKKYAPLAVSKGCVVIDNSSVFRMHPEVPLVVPEVNPEDLAYHKGIIANPNCSTIQAMLPLKVSGAGRLGIEDLENKAAKKTLKKFPYPIYNNCIPQIDVFMEHGYTKEEYKMIEETRKILHRPNLPITATAVRVPVTNCHGECINITLDRKFDIYDVRLLLENSPGIVVVDNPEKGYYPLASKVNGNDEVFVGRIRRDFSIPNGLNLWVVADNLRKGAATNAIQILEKLITCKLY